MARWESSVVVAAPIEEVFAYVSDFTRHPEWAGRALETVERSGPASGLGATFKTAGHFLGVRRDELTVTQFVAPTSLAFESTGDAGRFRHWFTLQQQGWRTRLTKGCESARLSLSSVLSFPLLAMLLSRRIARDVARIKERLEAVR